MKTGWALIVPLLIVAVPALAKDGQNIEATGKKQRTKLVCRADQWTGTRIARPVCASADEWAAFDEEQKEKARKAVNSFQDQERTRMPVDQSNPPQMGPNGFTNGSGVTVTGYENDGRAQP